MTAHAVTLDARLTQAADVRFPRAVTDVAPTQHVVAKSLLAILVVVPVALTQVVDVKSLHAILAVAVVVQLLLAVAKSQHAILAVATLAAASHVVVLCLSFLASSARDVVTAVTAVVTPAADAALILLAVVKSQHVTHVVEHAVLTQLADVKWLHATLAVAFVVQLHLAVAKSQHVTLAVATAAVALRSAVVCFPSFSRRRAAVTVDAMLADAALLQLAVVKSRLALAVRLQHAAAARQLLWQLQQLRQLQLLLQQVTRLQCHQHRSLIQVHTFKASDVSFKLPASFDKLRLRQH